MNSSVERNINNIQNNNVLNTSNLTNTLIFKQQDNQSRTSEQSKQLIDSTSQKPEFTTLNIQDNNLINNYLDEFSFNLKKDNNCYFIWNKQPIKHKEILFKQTESINHRSNDFIIKENSEKNYDLLFIPLALGAILFVTVTIFYRKYLSVFFESLIYGNQSNRLINEKNTHTKRLSFLLDLIFMLSISVLIDQVLQKLNIYSPPKSYRYLIFISTFAFLVVIKVYYSIVFQLSAFFSNQKKFFSELNDKSSLYTRCVGFFLLPLVFLISYSTNYLPLVFIYLSIFVFAIALIIRTIRMFQLFLGSGFSIFYFILYLCALEIAPLLLAYKGVISISSDGN